MVLLRHVGVAILMAAAPLVVAQYTLVNHAVQYGRTEMQAAALRYVSQGEHVIADTLSQLRELHQAGHTSCRADDRVAFRRQAHQQSFVREFGLLDSNGFAMCAEPMESMQTTAMLPKYDPNAPIVALGLLNEESKGAKAAIIGWHVANGIRIYARLEPDAIWGDLGPEYLRPYRHVGISLGGNATWLSLGTHLDEDSDSGSNLIEEVAKSSRYPIAVHISAQQSALMKIVGSLEFLIKIAAGLFGTVFVLLAIWMNRKPEQEDEFVLAIRNSEFVPYYQPVMDLVTGQLRGCEVLVRWVRPDGTVVSPGMFMHYAETSGHIFEITRQMMEKTVIEVGELYKDNPSFKLSVNLFAGHFEDRTIIGDVEDIYGGGPIAYEQLVFEITERQPLRDIDQARKIMAELRSLGAKVALDDAGTGHGGLAYLQKLGIDIIKIDKMFIDALGSDHSSTSIVDLLVELAGNLGMGIIAEGVETMDQIIKLREMGVTTAQGYIFAPALPAKMYIELARALTGHITDKEPIQIEDETTQAA